MSKFLQKTSAKCKIFAILTAVVLVAGLVLGIVFGFNQPATVSDVKTLTVQMNSYAGDTETLDKLEDYVAGKLSAAGLTEEYLVNGELASGNIYELVYTFDKETKTEELVAVKNAIAEGIKTEDAFKTAFIQAMVNEAAVASSLADGFVWRGILAVVVAMAVVFVYTILRHKAVAAIMVTANAFVTLLLTTAVAALCRIPVTASFGYAAMFSVFFGAVLSILFVGAIRRAKKADENAKASFEEVFFQAAPVNSTVFFTCAMAVAFLLIGLISITPVQWFAVSALVAMAAGLFVTLFLLPGTYLWAQKKADAEAARKARYDYKKNEEN